MMNLISILFGSIFITNIMFTKLEGLPAVDKSSKLNDILAMGVRKMLVGVLTTLVIYPLNKYILTDIGWEFLLPLLVVVIALLFTVIFNRVINKLDLGIDDKELTEHHFTFLNSVVIASILLVSTNPTFLGSLFEVIGFSLGHLMIMLIIYTARPRLELPGVPKPFKGMPLVLITVGIIAMVFMGIAGVL